MRKRAGVALLMIWAIAYVGSGIATELRLVAAKPVPTSLLADFVVYREALNRAIDGGDPYAVRYIGPGYFYPPPALIPVELLAFVGRLGFGYMFAAHVLGTIAIVGLIVWGVARQYGIQNHRVWYWWVLALASAPLMETLHVGQINALAMLGAFLVFVTEGRRPLLTGVGLALASITKVSPIVLGGYLALRRKWNEVWAAGLVLVAASVLTLARYGPGAFVSFPDAFAQLSRETPQGMAMVSLISGLCPGDRGTAWACAEPQDLQLALGIYLGILVIASGIVSVLLREREAFFIVTCLAVTLYPNVLWYHHFVFLLIPVLVWMGWRYPDPRVLAWVLGGMLVVQLDRWQMTHGLLIQLFGHCSILLLLGGQLRCLVRRRALGERFGTSRGGLPREMGPLAAGKAP